MSKNQEKKNFKCKKEKSKKEKKIYEVWTFVFNMKEQKDEKIGRCHGRFKKKKDAEKALEILTENRHGKRDSLFSDGTKIWRFKIVPQKIDRINDIETYHYSAYAIYDSKRKEWQVRGKDHKGVMREGVVLDLTPEGISQCYKELENSIRNCHHNLDDVNGYDKQNSISPYNIDDPF